MGAAGSSQSQQTSSPSRETVANNQKPKGRVLLYVDNANIYANSQIHAGNIHGFPVGVHDVTCRINVDQLVETIMNNRNAIVRNIYGAMPQKVAERLRNKGYTMMNAFNTQLTADAVEDIVLKKPEPNKPNEDIVLLVGGDKEMVPVIRKARNHGWNVEVWAYMDTVADVIKSEPRRVITGLTSLKVMPLERHFNEFALYDNKDFTGEIPEDRSILLTFKGGLAFMSALDAEQKKCVKETIIKMAKMIFRLPVALTSIESGETQDIKCALIFTIHEKDKATGKAYYNFQMNVFGKMKEFRDTVKHYMTNTFGGKYKLNVTKYSATPTVVYKAELCYGTMPGRSACKFTADACKFAHSMNEVQCTKCNMIGSHVSSKCKPRK